MGFPYKVVGFVLSLQSVGRATMLQEHDVTWIVVSIVCV